MSSGRIAKAILLREEYRVNGEYETQRRRRRKMMRKKATY